MKNLLFRLLLVMVCLGAVPAGAQTGALVVTNCATLNQNYTAGGTRPLTQDTTGRLCDTGGAASAGVVPYQFTSSGAMQSQLSITTGATVTLTVPAGTLYAVVCLRSGAASAINYSVDGTTTPVTGATGAGRQLAIGQCVAIQGAALIANFKTIATTGTTAIDVEYDK